MRGMTSQQKFLVEFAVLTIAALLAMFYPGYGLHLGVILIAIVRFGLKGNSADSWSVLGLIIVTGIALFLLVEGPSELVTSFLFGDVPRKMNGKPWISWNTIVFILWLVMVWRLRKRHDFKTPPIV